MGTEESGRYRRVLNKSQCMDFLSAGRKKKEAFAERWPIAEVRLYHILSKDDCFCDKERKSLFSLALARAKRHG